MIRLTRQFSYDGQTWSSVCMCGQTIIANYPNPKPVCWICEHPKEKSLAWYRKHHLPIILQNKLRQNKH